jgi:hypothetical protein
MKYQKVENRGRPSEKPAIVIKKFTREYVDSTWYYDLDKFENGPYLVEIIDPKFDEIEILNLVHT